MAKSKGCDISTAALPTSAHALALSAQYVSPIEVIFGLHVLEWAAKKAFCALLIPSVLQKTEGHITMAVISSRKKTMIQLVRTTFTPFPPLLVWC